MRDFCEKEIEFLEERIEQEKQNTKRERRIWSMVNPLATIPTN